MDDQSVVQTRVFAYTRDPDTDRYEMTGTRKPHFYRYLFMQVSLQATAEPVCTHTYTEVAFHQQRWTMCNSERLLNIQAARSSSIHGEHAASSNVTHERNISSFA